MIIKNRLWDVGVKIGFLDDRRTLAAVKELRQLLESRAIRLKDNISHTSDSIGISWKLGNSQQTMCYVVPWRNGKNKDFVHLVYQILNREPGKADRAVAAIKETLDFIAANRLCQRTIISYLYLLLKHPNLKEAIKSADDLIQLPQKIRNKLRVYREEKRNNLPRGHGNDPLSFIGWLTNEVETTKPIAGSVVGDLFYWAAGNVVNYVTESSEKKKAQERPYLEGLTNSRLFYWWLATLPGIKRLTFLPGSEADLILNYFLKFENCVNRWEFLQALGYPLSDRENAMLSVGQKMRTIYDDYGIHPKAYMVLPDSNPIIKPEQLDRYQGKELKERVRTNRGLVNLILFILYNQPARAMAVAQSVEKTFNSYYRKFGGGEIQSMIYALWVMLLNPSRFGFRESPIEILGSLDKIVGAAVKNDQCFDTYLSERDGFKGRPG